MDATSFSAPSIRQKEKKKKKDNQKLQEKHPPPPELRLYYEAINEKENSFNLVFKE